MQVPVDLQSVLERYRLPGFSRLAQPVSVHRGFSGASVYRIAARQGEFALRNWGPNCLPLRRLRGLHRLLECVRREGVQTVAVPLADESGSTIVLRDGAVWQLEPWMPGVADFHANPSRDRLRNTMRALADWHDAARRFEPADDEREWFRCDPADGSPAARERLQRVLMWQRGRLPRLQQALSRRTPFQGRPDHLRTATTALEGRRTADGTDFERLGQFIIESFKIAAPGIAGALQTATEWHVELQPCLRDVWHDHVLFTGDDVSGLIDPSACRCENVVSDLSRVLGSLVADDRSAWEYAVECYARQRELRPTELRLLPILNRSSVLLSGLTWLDRYYLQRRPISDPETVVARLEKIVVRLAHLTGRPHPLQRQ
jgi:Ser/Thr protein kinase RdoA (MazF antagonist)